MADEGLIDGRRTAYHRMGGVPKVTVLRVVDIEDGEAIAIPDNWDAEDAATPPRLMLKERKPKGGQRIPALRRGDRVLARTAETERKSVEEGKSVTVMVDPGGRRFYKNKNQYRRQYVDR